jgi:hypothetical protein
MSAIYGHIEQDIELRHVLVREVGLGFELPGLATSIHDLIAKGILKQVKAGGGSTAYVLVREGATRPER